MANSGEAHAAVASLPGIPQLFTEILRRVSIHSPGSSTPRGKLVGLLSLANASYRPLLQGKITALLGSSALLHPERWKAGISPLGIGITGVIN